MSNFGVPTDVQLAQINKLAKRTLSAEDVFVFSSKSAGNMMIPNRYTQISPELLQVMVDDAHKGVSFMYNHNWGGRAGLGGVPYGKVFGGRVEASDAEGETMAMYLDKYIARDDEVVDGMSANALIKKIETGILADTSIGFSTDNMKCSICAENYYSNKCRHWRGGTYEMGDGTQKVCTLTAMPPSIILANNNNALFEESIVWDGAYPGAMVTQSKHGDIVETPTGNFVVVQDKEELPENTLFFGKYHNGDIVTMVKKSDHKKMFSLGDIGEIGDIDGEGYQVIAKGTLPPLGVDENNKLHIPDGYNAKFKNEQLEGSESTMNKKLLKMLLSIGFTKEEAESLDVSQATTVLNAMAEKWEGSFKVAEPQEGVFMAQEQVKEKLGAELSVDEVLKLAKEGQDYHKFLSDEAIAMGVRAMGNDFPKETWETSFATMGTKAIKDIMSTFEAQANAGIPTGRLTDPVAGQMQAQSLPDEAYRV